MQAHPRPIPPRRWSGPSWRFARLSARPTSRVQGVIDEDHAIDLAPAGHLQKIEQALARVT
eukprot:14196669-Alexandrium_andersonii.AAC.1